jgi:hypothetical protein
VTRKPQYDGDFDHGWWHRLAVIAVFIIIVYLFIRIVF